jgi:hypothetical protein
MTAKVQDEEWRPCPRYEGRYEVSSLGRIRSLARIETSTRGIRRVPACILNPMKNVDGYLQVSLRIEGRLKTARLHRLIALAFHGDKQNPLHKEVAHLDNDRANARADNLKWVSRAENLSHRLLHGTDDRGEKHSSAKLTDAAVREIRATPGVRRALAEKFGVSPHTIDDVRSGKRWRHVQ